MLRDVVFLEAVGINPVRIHGGGKAITQRMSEAGLPARFVRGLRVTSAEAVQIVEEVLDTVINPSIVARLNASRGRAVGIPGKRVLVGRKLDPVLEGEEWVDFGFVGEVVEVRLDEVERAIAAEAVPVISPLAQDASGAALNINADIAAGTVAGGLRAAKMIYLSDVPGIMKDHKDPSTLIPSVNRAQIQQLVSEGIIAGGMLPKVQSALNALDKGVRKVHFIDGRVPHALLQEIFTDAGIGTEVIR
jgi:acetylglutamate kinase